VSLALAFCEDLVFRPFIDADLQNNHRFNSGPRIRNPFSRFLCPVSIAAYHGSRIDAGWLSARVDGR
jgi:hypothetical protein